MKTKLFTTATLLAIVTLCGGCVVYPAYDGPGYYGGYGGAVIVAPPVVVYHGYYDGYRGYGRGHGRHRH